MQISTVDERHRIVIVGGGAGGLELATRLGNTLGRRSTAEITLVDCNPTHVWKPLLHEVAAGTLEPHNEALEYLSHGADNHYRFILGRMNGLDRKTGGLVRVGSFRTALLTVADSFRHSIRPRLKLH